MATPWGSSTKSTIRISIHPPHPWLTPPPNRDKTSPKRPAGLRTVNCRGCESHSQTLANNKWVTNHVRIRFQDLPATTLPKNPTNRGEQHIPANHINNPPHPRKLRINQASNGKAINSGSLNGRRSRRQLVATAGQSRSTWRIDSSSAKKLDNMEKWLNDDEPSPY
ncbi:hypothetical protein V6N12_044315 [Hibiscus sabdariffa]|uniref:Uncharacterized protein n=1 Tax=Hibiscus sabdariffa TaxID=183260 RepID=A0ABR2DIJ3_9ROSI